MSGLVWGSSLGGLVCVGLVWGSTLGGLVWVV